MVSLVLGAFGVGGVVAAAAAGYVPIIADRPVSQPYAAHTSYTFSGDPVAPGMVSEQQAVAEAERYTLAAPGRKPAPDVTVTARFGTYADQDPLPRSARLVTFTGEGVNIAINDGGPYIRTNGDKTVVGSQPLGSVAPGLVTHEDTVVIDGPTGAFIDEEASSNQPPLSIATPLP